MKRTPKCIIAALLCASMLCSCSANEPQISSTLTSTEESQEIKQNSSENLPETTDNEPTTGTTATASAGKTDEPQEITADETPGDVSESVDNIINTAPSNTDTAIQPENPASSAANTTKSTTATTEKTVSAGFKLDWKLSSTWEEGGKKCGGYEVTINNNSGKAISNWTVEITVPSGFEISSGWNGIYTINGTTLTIKNESYNGEISNGGNTGFGFNYKSPTEFVPGKATVNGNAASSGSGSGNNNNNNEPASTNAPVSVATVPPAPEDPKGSNPVAVHGQLSVRGTQLIDKNGNGYQLRGMSTHGITWFPDFINEDAFRTLRDDWNTNVVRMAMYVDEWGNGQCYMKNKDGSRQLLEKGVDICIKLGMYVIIDWHVLNPGDPTAYTDEAISFFNDMSKKYADYPNIIYEIVNEPNGNASWSGTIKPYAEKVIPVIRKNDKDAVIIVGTPTWSQDIDQALSDPLKYDNVMYALHFYAATHTDWLRERTEKCVAGGLPIFVSEFGCCDASGNGANDFTQTEKWLKLLDKYGISYCNWNLANKDESSSAFKSSAKANGNWSASDYSESGEWIRKWFRNH